MTLSSRQGRPTIGVLAGWQFYRTATNLSYLKPIFNGINRATHDLDCHLLLGCGMGASASPADPIRPAWPIPAVDVDYVPIGPQNTDGLIVFNPLHSEARSQYIQDLITAGHAVLFIGAGETGPTIVADNTTGIIEAVGHLVEHGHRRIAFIAGSPDDMKGDTGDRLRAYRSALGHFGLQSDPEMVSYGRHVYDGGYSSIRQMLDSGVNFSAVLASNDEMALGAIQALKEIGRRIPEDVAVIGFDNRSEGVTQETGLSSVHVPLFQIGYHAVELMLQQLEGKIKPDCLVKVNTRLVKRESCGCGKSKSWPGGIETTAQRLVVDVATEKDAWVKSMTTAVLNQAQSLTEDECESFCRRLVDSLIVDYDQSSFISTLTEVLHRTTAGEDDAHIWQEAINYLKQLLENPSVVGEAAMTRVEDILDQARLIISAQMQQQHRTGVVAQRWSNSRLSLLTASLQTALDEPRIYEILAQHLPDMNISLACVALFEADGDDAVAWSLLRNGIAPEQDPIRIASSSFSPAWLSSANQAMQLALIPLADQTGQLGYVVFGTEFFDIYGAIVQQLGGAFNTARLYRQATEGRRLAEEANRMKSRFLSTISHELRTPLNLIIGLSGMVLRDSDESETPLPEPVRKDVDRIRVYSQHLGGLIGDVIDLATSDAGQLRLNLQTIDLGQTLRMVTESGGQLAADKGLEWQAHLPESGPWVRGDQTRLRQVALNLINNAIKFTTRGEVKLWLENDQNFVTVNVQDTGLGISPEDQQVIFDEFRQSERSVALGYGGLGLGLAICKRLIEMHNGTISVHSSGEEGTGSTFSFTLPVVLPPEERTQQLEILSLETQSVVVLTYCPGNSARLCETLHERGFSVQMVSLERGFNWRLELAKSHPNTIILDVSTESKLGWDTLKEIKSTQSLVGIPVLLYSSSQPNHSLLELDYLTKPIEISELTRALDQHWLISENQKAERNILVVDDEPNTLEMHARIVQAHSATNRVLKARNGKEALDILHRESVDLILLDLQMPEMDGFAVLETLRGMENTRKIPVIVVTGKELTEADMARLNQGVAAVLGKGLFSIEETITHISSALEHKRRLSGEAQRLVRSAMAYLHENFSEVITRREIARHVGITEDHLTFCFRQELGTTPIEYLQRYRINQARRELKESQKSITEIALNVGFSDSGYFSRIFRRETGMSPEAFRRS